MKDITFVFNQIGGDFESIAQRVKEEGYHVYYIKNKGQAKGREDTGVGIFKKEEMLESLYHCLNTIPKDKLVLLYDDNGKGEEADFIRSQGYTVIGGSKLADDIEYNRDKGTKLMQKIGLNTPKTHVFTSISDGISFMNEQDKEKKFVFKPNGEDCAGSNKTYTGKNKQDMIDFMKYVKDASDDKSASIEKFELQEFIEGYEADFSAYFNGEEFLDGSTNLYIEEKKSGDDNKGEATGSMGNVCFYVAKSAYYDKFISRLRPLLKDAGYVGQISINNIFAKSDGQPYGLEFTPRFGYDGLLTECHIHKKAGKNISDFLLAVAGKGDFKFNHDLIGCGVRVYTGSISLKKEEVSGRYFSFKPDIEENLWYYSVSKQDNAWVIEDNPVLVVNAATGNLDAAIKSCYAICEMTYIPDAYYRKQIGERAPEVIKFLKSKGWL